MEPYSKKKLTYRLTKKRRATENVFEIWINRFRIFAKRVILIPDKKTSPVLIAIFVLDNLLRLKPKV